MKLIDGIVLGIFVVALVILCFLQQCSLDIYFLVFGFAIAIMSGITMFTQNKNAKNNNNSQTV